MNFSWQLRSSRLSGLWYVVLMLGAVLLARSFAGLLSLVPLVVVPASLLWHANNHRRARLSAVGYHQGSWTVVSGGRNVPAALSQSHFPGRNLGVMEFSVAGGKPLRLMLWPDSLSRNDFRELRLALA